MLGFPNATTFPSGTWSKASDTAKIMEFILYMCDVYSDKIPGDRILYYIQVAGTALGTCMKGLYDADLWIEPGCYETYMSVFLMLNTSQLVLMKNIYSTGKPFT